MKYRQKSLLSIFLDVKDAEGGWLSCGMLCCGLNYRPDYGGTKHLRNVGQFLPDFTA
jgi:hypothetical protein